MAMDAVLRATRTRRRPQLLRDGRQMPSREVGQGSGELSGALVVADFKILGR